MPPKTVPLSAQPAAVHQSLGMNPDYMLPHQRDQFRRHLQTITDLNNRKPTEPQNIAQIEASIAEARTQIQHLATQAAQNEKLYPTKEAFQAYAAQVAKQIQIQQASAAAGKAGVMGQPRNMSDLRVRYTQITSRLKEIEESLNKPDTPEDQKAKLRNEQMLFNTQLEQIREIFKNQTQAPLRIAAAGGQQGTGTGSQTDTTATASPATPPLNVPQPGTPTTRNVPPAPSMQQSSSQPNIPAAISMGQLPRPSVNTAVPPPRPTLSGGYPVGNPLLGTAGPGGVPGAFLLAQDGDSRLLSKRKLQDLVKSIDPDERLEPDVEEVQSLLDC
jgi:hypothetical protein